MKKKTYTFRPAGDVTNRWVEISADDELLYRWPLCGGWYADFTLNILTRLLGPVACKSLTAGVARTVSVELDAKAFKFVAPDVYNRIRPSLLERIKQFFTTKKAR